MSKKKKHRESRQKKKVKKSKHLKLVYVKNHDKITEAIVKLLDKYDLRLFESMLILESVKNYYASNLIAALLDKRNRNILSRALVKGGKK